MHRFPILLIAALAISRPATAQTLPEALALVQRLNPTLRGEQFNQRAITENSAQSRAGWRPTVSIHINGSYQKGPYTDTFALGSFTSNYAEGYVSASQTLYSFGHIGNQVRAADARSRAEEQQLRLTESQVFADAITAYMDVLRDRLILDVRRDDLETLIRQVSLTTARYNLGGNSAEQVTKSDVEQAETRRRSAEVALAQARATLAASAASFHAVIGTDPKDLTMPDSLPGLPPTIDVAVKMAMAANPQLSAMRATKAAAFADIDTARSQWGPQIQVQGAFGTIGPASPFKGREYGEQISGTVSLIQPLYNGDLYNAQIRQARDRDEQAAQNIERGRREAVQNIVSNWHMFENGLQSISAGIAEVKSGEISLQGYQLEYGYGLRSTTDVLYADQNLRAAQVQLASSRHDTIVAEARILAAMGCLEGRKLLPKTAHYDAGAALRKAQARGWEPLQAPISSLDRIGW